MWVVVRPISTKREGDAHGSFFERKILVKSPEPGNRAQRKVEYKNYHAKLWGEIITGNYEWKLSASILSREKCEIYRDTGVSKKICNNNIVSIYPYLGLWIVVPSIQTKGAKLFKYQILNHTFQNHQNIKVKGGIYALINSFNKIYFHTITLLSLKGVVIYRNRIHSIF